MDTASFIIHIKTGDFYKDIADDGKNRYDASNYEDEWKRNAKKRNE